MTKRKLFIAAPALLICAQAAAAQTAHNSEEASRVEQAIEVVLRSIGSLDKFVGQMKRW